MHAQIKEKIEGKVILITGGTGSFGNSVVRKLLELSPAQIIIFSRDEKKQFDMRNKYNTSVLRFVIGDVRDNESVDRIMDDSAIDYIFHAAALKQVPSCEFFPLEAVKTNILGANNVIHAAMHHNVKKVIILSTDKAAYPLNAMGMTKALMEKIMIANSREMDHLVKKRTVLCGVRYGNVLYSRGSILPFFVSQIVQKKSLTVTNNNMTRFLLPLPDAVDLVLYAFSKGENGHMYVKKAPACTLQTIAESICKIFDYKKGYHAVGFRAGEKMHETLVTQEEMARAVDKDIYYDIPPESQQLDYNKYDARGDRRPKSDLNRLQPYTSDNTVRLDVAQTVNLLLKLPEIQEELKKYKKGESSEITSEIFTHVG